MLLLLRTRNALPCLKVCFILHFFTYMSNTTKTSHDGLYCNQVYPSNSSLHSNPWIWKTASKPMWRLVNKMSHTVNIYIKVTIMLSGLECHSDFQKLHVLYAVIPKSTEHRSCNFITSYLFNLIQPTLWLSKGKKNVNH